MSEADVTVTIGVSVAKFAAAMQQMSEAIGVHLLPALQPLAEALGLIRDRWPGMPYTAPSDWTGYTMVYGDEE